jgi:hypothetical protein
MADATLQDVVDAITAQQTTVDHIAAMLAVVLRTKGFSNIQIEAMV